MNQLDRIEAKLDRLLALAERYLADKAELEVPAKPAVKPQADTDQSLQALFSAYPAFREDFFTLHPELAGLKGPMGAAMLKEATVDMVARSLQIDTVTFVRQVNEVLAGYE